MMDAKDHIAMAKNNNAMVTGARATTNNHEAMPKTRENNYKNKQKCGT